LALAKPVFKTGAINHSTTSPGSARAGSGGNRNLVFPDAWK
jgi:hypothetical protein